MENKEHINDIIKYLKDDRPAHAYASMRRYMEHLGYDDNEIGKHNINFSDFRKEFFKRLDIKTGWGKEQLKTLFDDIYFEMSNEI